MPRHAMLSLCGLMLLATAACKHNPPSELDGTLADSSAVENPTKAEIDPPAFMGDLPFDEQRTILLAAGCQDDDTLTAAACTFCAPESDGAAPISAVSIMPGQFGARRGAVVFADGCGDDGSGQKFSSLVAVTLDEAGQWALLGRTDFLEGVMCQNVSGRENISNTVCRSEFERYGTHFSYYDLFDWSIVTSGERKEPFRTTVLELADHDSCEKNMGIEHIVVDPTTQDDDNGDGVPQLVLTITTTTGPFTGTLDTCPEEGFSGPLTPTREPTTTTTTYIYELNPEGPVERQGLSTYLSLGKEFEDLMEQ
jgi:hypothetical protein